MSAKIRAIREKESRWDIIRKKHINCINVTSETVKKFLNMEFVDERALRDGGKARRRLNPVVVMDLRHEMIQRRPKKEVMDNRNTPSPGREKTNRESRMSKELSMIEKELTKFKSSIKKLRGTPRKNCKSQLKKKKRCSIHIKLNSNSELLDTSDEDKIISPKSTETPKEEPSQEIKSQSDLTLPIHPPNTVRFVDDIEIISISRDESTFPEDLEDDDELDEEIDSLLEDVDTEDMLVPVKKSNTHQNFMNFSKKTVTTTTTTTFEQFCYMSQDSSTEDTETTESSEVNFYQMFDSEEPKEDLSSNDLTDTLQVKSMYPSKEEKSLETEDLVEEIIRVKAVSNVAARHRLLRTYMMKWMHFTTIQKITKDSTLTTKSQRMTKIDAFLKKIREQKRIVKAEDKSRGEGRPPPGKDNAIVMVKRYQSKVKLQQDIIEVQKLKLERQERMIAELRLSRLSDDAKKFKQDLREELRNAMRTGDIRLRAKAKCLQVVGNVVEESESQMTAYGNMIPKFLAKMQERALERQLRHEQAKERRVQLDMEKDQQRMSFEEEKRKADEEAKRLRMLELQEKRRREKQEKMRKEQEREKFLEDTRKAKAFYRRYLLRRFGLDRLKKLVNRKRTLELRVTNLRKKIKMKSCFKAWLGFTVTAWTLRYDKAREFYELYVQRMSFRIWRENLLMARGQWLVAVDWHEMRLGERFFSAWLAKTRESKLAEETKLRHAEAHYKWHIQWKMLEHWQRLHSVLKLEKETEERRQRWRHKIWELLPDYTPAIDE